MNRPLLIAAAIVAGALAAPEANAQVFWPDDCGRSVGWAVGATPARRDWDFTTPGPVAVSSSPVISQWCNQEAANGRVASWFGIDLIPIYQHSYRRLRDRGPLLVMLNIGGELRLGRKQHLGLHATTNALAWGAGLRWQFNATGHATRRQGFGLRANVLWGTEPDLQLVLDIQPWRSKDVRR